MSVLERIKSYYTIENRNGRLSLWRENSEKPLHLLKTDKPVYLTFGKDITDKEEADREVAKGNVIKIPEIEIYRLYFGWDEEEYTQELYGCDIRTLEFITSLKEQAGLDMIKHGWDEVALLDAEPLSIFPKAVGESYLGKVKDGRWCYQFGYPSGSDDYNIEKIYFNRRPSKRDIKMARQAEDIELDFFLRRIKPKFRCWECGAERHWLDVPGSISDKIESIYEKYCGC